MMPIGPTELVILLLIVLYVFGAGKLPEVGRTLGRSLRELRGVLRDEASACGEGGEKSAQQSGPRN